MNFRIFLQWMLSRSANETIILIQNRLLDLTMGPSARHQNETRVKLIMQYQDCKITA